MNQDNKIFVLVDFQRIWQQMLPLTYTRPISDLRIGVLTLRKKWELMLKSNVQVITAPYLMQKGNITLPEEAIFINSSILPERTLARKIRTLKPAQALQDGGEIIAWNGTLQQSSQQFSAYQWESPCIWLHRPWDLFLHNATAIERDFQLLTQGRTSTPLSKSNRIIGDKKRIFLEEGAIIEGATLNANGAMMYFGAGCEVMEGTMLRGAIAVGEHAVVKMGAKIYGATTIGDYAKVGGEINNSVIWGNSNKAHDGYLGNSVLGEWCNLGADTNNSNLKNDYGKVRMWSYAERGFIDTNLQFCGLIMGDHSKCGINTMFNTGTVVGVSCNIFGSDFPPKHIPSFAWGGGEQFTDYRYDKAMETAARVLARRNQNLSDFDYDLLYQIWQDSEPYRIWNRKP